MSGEQIAKFQTDEFWYGLSFSSDSKFVFTRELDDGKINQVWRILSFNDLLVEGCNIVDKYLSSSGSDASAAERHICDNVQKGSDIPLSQNPVETKEATEFLDKPVPPLSNQTQDEVDSSTSSEPKSFAIEDFGPIQFSAGETSGRVGGTLEVENIARYTFEAAAGQSASLLANSSGGDISLILISPDGSFLVDGSTNAWSGVLPEDGVYIVGAVNEENSSITYSLELQIEP